MKVFQKEKIKDIGRDSIPGYDDWGVFRIEKDINPQIQKLQWAPNTKLE